MVEHKIKFNSIKDVKDYMQNIFCVDGEIVISSLDNKYRVDGKSVMGILSLDLTSPLIITLDTEDADSKFSSAINKYIV